MPLTRLATLAAFALLLCVPSGAPAHDENGKHKADNKVEADNKKQPKPPALQWNLDSSHTALAPRDGSFYLRMSVKAAKVKVKGRQPLNLAFVFDRSGSMDEDAKIGFVRQAGHLVVDNLTPQDFVSLISYNHRVQTLVPMHAVVNREYLHHRVDEIHAEGHTNLSGGFLEGCAQLAKRRGKPGLHHLILLTDGLANRGVTDTDQLVALVKRYTQNGITVTTVGVGSSYNEKLLGRMSEAGGGRYIYVDKPDQIPAAFKRELGALLSVVAQNAKIKMKLPPGIKVEKVFGFDEPQKPGVLEVPLGDLSSSDERVVLVRMHRDQAASANSDELIHLHAFLTYDDIVEADRSEDELDVHIEQEANGTSQTSPVLAYAQLVEAVDKISKAVASMDRGLAAEVLKIRQRQFPALKKAAWASRDQEFVNKAYMFEHYVRDLEHLINEGALHEHSEARARLQKKMHYDRYLRQHHRHRH